jgi:hypothetical protein
MSTQMPPVPPASRSKHGPKRNPEVSKDDKLVKHEHHPNSAEEATPPISSRTPRTRVTSAAGGSPNHVSFSRRRSGSIYDACRNDGDAPDNHA